MQFIRLELNKKGEMIEHVMSIDEGLIFDFGRGKRIAISAIVDNSDFALDGLEIRSEKGVLQIEPRVSNEIRVGVRLT